jgi:YbbR domain-containing protein
MFRRLTHNFLIKVFCLLVASGLWIYVSAGQSTVGKFPSSLNIKAINAGSGLVAIYDTKTVNVKIMAEPSVWRQLSADSFSAYVDLSGAHEGTIEIPVNVVSSVAGVQILEKDPSSILVSLETIIAKDVSINKKIEGNAGEGLVAGAVEVNPTEVSVKGPKSIVESFSEGTVVVTLNGETGNFTKTLPVIAYDEKGEIIKELEFRPSEVEASVSIVKASNNKTVGIKVKTNGSPKSGYFVSNITVSPSVVDITGTSSIISQVNYVETYALDITNADVNIEKEISLNPVEGVTLQAGSPSKVAVKVTVSPGEVSKELNATLSYDNLASDYRVTNVAPSQVRVAVSGPLAKISTLKSSDIVLGLDQRGKSAGTYNFDISTSGFRLPEGVSVASVLPSTLSITVDRK